jgi:uncharacterized membrane protein
MKRFGHAWVLLTAALAAHVADEALNDFLSVYNPAVQTIRARLPWLPLPTFSFEAWLLIAAILALLALSVFAYRGARWTVPFAYAYAVVMLPNGTQHILASVYLGRPMPGVYSSPLLVVASLLLLRAARAHSRNR